MELVCKFHPKYQAKRRPTADCWFCQTLWEFVEVSKNTDTPLKSSFCEHCGPNTISSAFHEDGGTTWCQVCWEANGH